MSDLRARIERAVGQHLRPSLECEPHPDETAIVDSVMAEIAIRVDDKPPQWTALAQYLRLDSECTTSLTLTEPITAPWPTPAQQARLAPPTQFRLIADVLLVRRLDEPHADDDRAVVW